MQMKSLIKFTPAYMQKAVSGTLMNLISGCLSGMIGNTVVYPLDIAKNIATIKK